MEIRRIVLGELDPAQRSRLFSRSAVPDPALRAAATAIVSRIRRGGDAAVVACNNEYGGARRDGALRVPTAELELASASLDPDVRTALDAAIANIEAAHRPQLPTDSAITTVPGVTVARCWSPLQRVGVYVPGGRAAYPSSLLMGVIPAIVAGVPEVVITSPADDAGNLSQTMLAAAARLGVGEVYATGGAQAVAALTYGTETIRPVQKIVGPGNAWVTAAKLAVYGDVGVDLPAGPSEALVIADSSADPKLIAADLICQAEHGPESPVALATDDADLADEVSANVDKLLARLERADIISTALANHGLIVITSSIDEAIDFANEYAPEHLTIHTADAATDATRTTAAGSVFVGPWAPESAGDYATGANHVLPTGGLAAAYGPLSVEDFGSWRQVQTLTREGLATLRPTISALATAEGLTAHRLAADIRFESDRT